MTQRLEAFPPRQIILSVLGGWVRRFDGWISVAALIELMRELGVEEQAVRSAVSRLKRRGMLLPERRGSAAGYALSEDGARILGEGDLRIYGRREARLEDGWVLAVFSVPDAERARRHVLRTQLAWLGFGHVAAGVWVAPSHVLEEARAALTRLELHQYVHLFQAHHAAFGTPRELVAQAWDVPDLSARYRDLMRVGRPLLRRWRAARALDDRRAFADYTTILTHWRPLPFLDPALPVETLPAGWPGTAAWRIFHELAALLHEPAIRHVEHVCGARASDRAFSAPTESGPTAR